MTKALVAAFVPRLEELLAPLSDDDAWATAMALESGDDAPLSEADLDAASEVVADFIDLKSPFAERFLTMMFSVPSEEYKVSKVAASALDLLFILHADHEQNASTSTVRLVGSTGANPYACVAAGISALWGPAHGGANEAVLDMLSQIGSKKNVPKFVEKAHTRGSDAVILDLEDSVPPAEKAATKPRWQR